MTYCPVGTITSRHGIDSQNVVFGFAATQTAHLDTGAVDVSVTIIYETVAS